MKFSEMEFKNRTVENPNRYKLTKVVNTDDTFDMEPCFGNVIEEGTLIDVGLLNNIKEELKTKNISSNGDLNMYYGDDKLGDYIIADSTTFENIANTPSLSTHFYSVNGANLNVSVIEKSSEKSSYLQNLKIYANSKSTVMSPTVLQYIRQIQVVNGAKFYSNWHSNTNGYNSYPDSIYGNDIVISDGGHFIAGSGESAFVVYDKIKKKEWIYKLGEESTQITADGSIIFNTNLQSGTANSSIYQLNSKGLYKLYIKAKKDSSGNNILNEEGYMQYDIRYNPCTPIHYQHLYQLGLNISASLEEIIEAMEEYTSLKFVANNTNECRLDGLPSHNLGLLVIEKAIHDRVLLTYTEMESETNNNEINSYQAMYRANSTPKLTGWKKIKFENA